MSRNYAHSYLSRRDTRRSKKGKRSNLRIYLLIIVIVITVGYLSREIEPPKIIVEKDITNQIKTGEFN